jgi:hypothetical protein
MAESPRTPSSPKTPREEEEERKRQEEEERKRREASWLPSREAVAQYWEKAKRKLDLWKQAIVVFCGGVAVYGAAFGCLLGGRSLPSSTRDGARVFFVLLLAGVPMVSHRCGLLVEQLERQVAGGKYALEKWDCWYVRATTVGSTLVTRGKQRVELGKKYIGYLTRGRDYAKKATFAVIPVVAYFEMVGRS